MNAKEYLDREYNKCTVDQGKEVITELMDVTEWAWTIIANAGGGDWDRESTEWQEAAKKWRNEYHKLIKAT